MSSFVENKEAAWRFIEFANSSIGQEILAGSGRTVPSLKAVAGSTSFLSPGMPPANSQVYLDTVSTIRTVPIMSSWVGIEEQVSNEIEKAFYGEVDLDQAIDAAIQVAQPYFDEQP
jgi:multiple sugar transport system substrate-binding protein